MADIVITEFMDEPAVERLRAAYATLYDPALADRPADIPALLAGARALVVRNRTQVRGALLDAGRRLVCVGRLGVGLDNIDVEACRARGIAVMPATGANDLSVAEYVITVAGILLRGAYFATADVVAGRWPRQRLMGRELSGKVLGLVGFGAIARETAARGRSLGMQVMACDPLLRADDPAWRMAGRGTLDEVLARSDIVSLHVPLTADTRHMIDGSRLARMKRDAIMVNAARGGVVDEIALAAALRAGRLGGAALDVFETEPVTAASGAIFAGIANLILTPHIAGVTVESNERVSGMIADAVLERLRKAP
jgi:(S)-sulfolactate dehydrogenase